MLRLARPCCFFCTKTDEDGTTKALRHEDDGLEICDDGRRLKHEDTQTTKGHENDDDTTSEPRRREDDGWYGNAGFWMKGFCGASDC